MTLARMVIFPSRYIQGPGILPQCGDHIQQLGDICLVVAGKTALSQTKTDLMIAFEDGGVEPIWGHFSGVASEDEVNQLTKLTEQEQPGFIVGIGGGTAIDTAKAVALFTEKPIITIPTIASTESATSTISVLYDQEGNFSRYVQLSRNPELVLVDSRILVAAPSRYLAAGIAGALATSYAVEACIKSQAVSIAGGIAPALVRYTAKSCQKFCFKHARQVIQDARAYKLTPLLEDAFELPLLFSLLSFESGGLAAAHAFYHGVREVWPKQCHRSLGSEIVSFGTTVQLFLENRSQREINRVVALHADLGMPLTLTDLFLPCKAEELIPLAKSCAQDSSMKNMPKDFTTKTVLQAILSADQAGRKL